jgi:hypothetical protein
MHGVPHQIARKPEHLGDVYRRAAYFCTVLVLTLLPLVTFQPSDVHAQARHPVPLPGHHPGGAVGIKGGATPPEGVGFFNINRLYYPGDLKDANGDTIKADNKTVIANIAGVAWNTNFKIGGMTWGGLLAVPFNDTFNRPSGQPGESSGYGLGDIIFAPFALYGTSTHFDYQLGAGVWAPSGSFTPGSPHNHGSGYWEAIYSLGGVYYPDGNRKSFSISSVVRIEQNFTQRHTDIHIGDDIIMDWGIGSPLLPLDATHKHVIQAGVSGFATTQFTRETGTNAALNTSFYRVFSIGPEFNYFYPDWKLKLVFRPQWEFDARNTSEGRTFWFGLVHHFGSL